MTIANVQIETLPGRAYRVAQRMASRQGLGPIHVEDDHRLSGLWWLAEDETAEGLCEALRAMDGEILAVNSSFGGRDAG
jgi:hypothetical protein